jgi:hypothetical protein
MLVLIGKFIMKNYDILVNNTTLANVYPYFFSIASDSTITVAQALTENNLSISFNRQIVEIYYTEWCDLKLQLQNFVFNQCSNDILIWRWSPRDIFLVHSLYERLDFGGVSSKEYTTLWMTKK